MRHGVFGRRLGRTRSERQALFRALSRAVILHERVQTTGAKAKAVRPYLERLITVAKRGGLPARRLLFGELRTKPVVEKLMGMLATRYARRPGGYTSIVHLRTRVGDRADLVIFSLVSETEKQQKGKSNA